MGLAIYSPPIINSKEVIATSSGNIQARHHHDEKTFGEGMLELEQRILRAGETSPVPEHQWIEHVAFFTMNYETNRPTRYILSNFWKLGEDTKVERATRKFHALCASAYDEGLRLQSLVPIRGIYLFVSKKQWEL